MINEKTYAVPEPHISLHGHGVSYTKPDKFSLSVGISAEGRNFDYIYDWVVSQTEKFLNALREWKNDDDSIESDGISQYHYEYRQKDGKWPIGSNISCVSTTITIESIRVDEISHLLDIAKKYEVTEISKVRFQLTDRLRKEQRKRALISAAKTAYFDAKTTAEAFGTELSRLLSIEIVSGFRSEDHSLLYNKSMSCCSSSSDSERDYDIIETGKIGTSVEIEVVYSLIGNGV